MRPLLPAFLLLAALGQSQVARPSFEVAAVKPGDPRSTVSGVGPLPGGRFTAESVTLRRLIEMAYELRPFQVTGGPSWITAEKFSIAAKAPDASATPAQIRLMLQSLLAERFQVAVHTEMREQAVYRMTVNAKHGMTPAEAGSRKGFSASVAEDGSTHFVFNNTTMPQLATMLTSQLEALVEDHTGLNGGFDFEVDGTSEKGTFGSAAPALPQVGLKLESRKTPVAILVVDRAQRPTEN